MNISVQAPPNLNQRGKLALSTRNLYKKRTNEEFSDGVLVKVRRDPFKKPPAQDDRYDLFGKSIALRMRYMDKRQCLLVEKRINDVLYEAEMSVLE